MSDRNSLINLGDLSKPATVLIERVSDAIGGCLKPWQVKRVAKAKAEEKIILAKANMKISALEQRAMARLLEEESRKQKNIEDITLQAIPKLSKEAKPEKINQDWLVDFFNRCSNISDEEMQAIWSGILAEEANLPGKFYKHTLQVISNLDNNVAEAFMYICTFCWKFGDLTSVLLTIPIIWTMEECPPIIDESSLKFRMNSEELSLLSEIGLINFLPYTKGVRFGTENSFADQAAIPETIVASYFGRKFLLKSSKENPEIDLRLGRVEFTTAGLQLLEICDAKPDEEIFLNITNAWRKKGMIIEELS